MLDIKIADLATLTTCPDQKLPRPSTVYEAIQATKRDIALIDDPSDQLISFDRSMGAPIAKQISKRNVIANVFSGKNGKTGTNKEKYPVNIALKAYKDRAQERLELLTTILVRSQRHYGQDWPQTRSLPSTDSISSDGVKNSYRKWAK